MITHIVIKIKNKNGILVNYYEIQSFIKELLEEHDKLSTSSPGKYQVNSHEYFKEHDKLSVSIPKSDCLNVETDQEEHDKLSVSIV